MKFSVAYVEERCESPDLALAAGKCLQQWREECFVREAEKRCHDPVPVPSALASSVVELVVFEAVPKSLGDAFGVSGVNQSTYVTREMFGLAKTPTPTPPVTVVYEEH